MFKEFFINKITNTYSDCLVTFGLSNILEDILNQLNVESDILIEDIGHSFKLTISKKIIKDDLNKIKAKELFPYIKTDKKDSQSEKFNHILDYIFEKEVNEKYWKHISDGKGNDEKIQKPHIKWSTYSTLRVLGGVKLNNRIALEYKNSDTPELLERILYTHSQPLNKANLRSTKEESVLQVLNPTQGKGVNKSKASGITPSGVKGPWEIEYLKLIGFHQISLPRIVDEDVKIFCVIPKRIYWKDLQVINSLFDRTLEPKNSLILYDILTIVEYIINILKYTKEKEYIFELTSKQKLINGFYTAYFKNMGKVKSLANINLYKYPNWINISNLESYINLFIEHKEQISLLSSREEDILLAYRNFLSSEKINDLVEFFSKYSIFLMKSLASKKFYIKPFLLINLNILMSSLKEGKTFSDIFENKGFLNIAKAIRNATINAMYAHSKGDKKFEVHYGMAQDLKRKSMNKEDLIIYISQFISFYNKETEMVISRFDLKTGETRRKVSTSDLKDIIGLIDKYGAEMVGNLLLAYGYAKEKED